jgi:glucokinase
VVSEWGRLKKDRACSRALDWFLSLYGAEAGNVALKFLALGGIFLGGGIAPKLVDRMKEGKFLEAFLDKGRFRKLLETIPIRIVLNDETALLGTAVYARTKRY